MKIICVRACLKCCWKNHDKLMKLYKESEEKIDSELDVIKITNSLRKLKLLLKNSLLTDEIHF